MRSKFDMATSTEVITLDIVACDIVCSKLAADLKNSVDVNDLLDLSTERNENALRITVHKNATNNRAA